MNLPDKTYSVIYADPPWSYRQCGTGPKSRGNAVQHYHTMAVEDICALPVQRLAGGGGLRLVYVGHLPDYPGCATRDAGMGVRVQDGSFRLGEEKPQERYPVLGHGSIYPRQRGGLPARYHTRLQGKRADQEPCRASNCRGTDTGAQRKAGRGSEAHRNLDGRRTQNRAFCEAASDWMGRLGRRAAAGVTKKGGT